MIELKNIYKSYGEQSVLENISTKFEQGKLTMLLGPSGSGKSTILKMINRLIEADQGDILINDKHFKDYKPEDLRRSIGYAIQGVGLFPHMTVRDNIAIVPKLLKWSDEKTEKRVDELMELMGIPEEFGSKRPGMLSGGEAQRIGVARALCADPDILLMDEPFGALDPIIRKRLQQEFVTLQKKLHKTVIFVTHDIGEAIRMADHLVLINEGKIIGEGTPESMVRQSDQLIKSFLGDQFTLELLEKYSVDDYARLLNKPNQEKSLDTNYDLVESVSFREVLTFMLSSGQTQVAIKSTTGVYDISFDDMISLFGGSING